MSVSASWNAAFKTYCDVNAVRSQRTFCPRYNYICAFVEFADKYSKVQSFSGVIGGVNIPTPTPESSVAIV